MPATDTPAALCAGVAVAAVWAAWVRELMLRRQLAALLPRMLWEREGAALRLPPPKLLVLPRSGMGGWERST